MYNLIRTSAWASPLRFTTCLLYTSIIDKQPTIKPSASEWHVVAEGDLPPKLKDGERAKTYLITKNDAQKYIDFAFWDGEAFGRERKCNIVVSGVSAWRELPEPWEGAEK